MGTVRLLGPVLASLLLLATSAGVAQALNLCPEQVEEACRAPISACISKSCPAPDPANLQSYDEDTQCRQKCWQQLGKCRAQNNCE